MNPVVSFPEMDAFPHPALFAAAFEACPESLAVVERARIGYANPAFARLFGYTHPEELRHKRLAELLPENRACTQGVSAENMSDGELCGYSTCRFQGKRRDGTRVAMEACCSGFCCHDRSLLIIAAHDVGQPERRRVVRDSERRFRTIFETSAIGIGHCTLDGRIVESNRALEGGTRDHSQVETHYVRRDRSLGWARLTLSLVRGPDSEPEFAIVMADDITARKQAEQELYEAHKMEAIGRLVGGVAHDFNNLLTGIMLYCDLLLAGLPAAGRWHHHAEEIRLASEQGAALIQQLMAVARQHVAEPRVLSLNDVLASMRNLLARLIGENIELVTDLAPDLGRVRMDPAQAQQIILNLVLNARDAMPDGGRVTLETRNCNGRTNSAGAGASVVLNVIDTGCGMDAETRSHLFEPFFTTKQARGTGLGLATVQSAVRQGGGEIQVQSEPGKGTAISILLPQVEDELPEKDDGIATEPLSGEATILLVEDDAAVRGSMQRLLSARGYRVLEAATGTEALGLCQRHEGAIHLLLADVVMPGMSGQEVAEQACAIRPDMRVLYTSGYSHAVAGENSNLQPLLLFRKPFSGQALLRKVREVLAANQPQESEGKKRESP